MSEHYFTENPTSISDEKTILVNFKNKNFTFITDNSVFSKAKLDKGSEILLNSIDNLYGDVLDLGCGYGAISIILKKFFSNINLTAIDINDRSVNLTRKNANLNNVDIQILKNDSLKGLDKFFDFVVINPPIRIGKQKVLSIFKDIAIHMRCNSILFTVIRTNQGAMSYFKYLNNLFDNVELVNIESGYRIIKCKNPRGINV